MPKMKERIVGFVRKNQWLMIGAVTLILVGSVVAKIVIDKNSSNNTELVAEVSPTETLLPTETVEPTLTEVPTIALKPTSTPKLTPTPTPTVTLTITPTASPSLSPSLTPISSIQSFNFTLDHQGSFTGSGSGSGQVTKNSNSNWRFSINASFSNLSPNKNYQLWLCGNECSSFTNAMFATDSNGVGSLTGTTIEHNQNVDQLKRIAVWDMSVGTTDPSVCIMTSSTATPCLQGQFSF